MTHSSPLDIFHPAACLALWTLTVLLMVPIRRFRAAMAGRVTVVDFKTGESANVPPDVSVPNRVYMNLLEAPVLFYLLCVVAFVTVHVDHVLQTLAWVYLALRVLHSLIYLSYNNVFHRLAAFAISNVILAAMWMKLSWQLMA